MPLCILNVHPAKFGRGVAPGSMSSEFNLDRESFQAFLANALAVHESGLDQRSLSALIEVQRFITTDEFTLDRALCLIAESALEVCNASGIAIALLEANQLVYRAGSGSSAADVGHHVSAVLSVCARSEPRAEILRVENARTDLRIEAEICRQFGATSLLILPIYQAQSVAGVLQVHFSEAHSFLEPEVRTYRVMASLIEEAILRDRQRGQKEGRTEQPASLAHAIAQITSQGPVFSDTDDGSMQAAPQPSQSFLERAATELTAFRARAATPIGHIFNRSLIVNFRQFGAAVTIAILVVSAIWVAHRRHPVPATIGSALSTPNDIGDHVSPTPVSLKDKSRGSSHVLEDASAPSSAFKRIQIGPDEVDYIAEDVTIRYYTNRIGTPQTRGYAKEVRIGQDVTVRYFADKPRFSQTRAASISSQTTERSLPASQ
jgi:hypothetical protein